METGSNASPLIVVADRDRDHGQPTVPLSKLVTSACLAVLLALVTFARQYVVMYEGAVSKKPDVYPKDMGDYWPPILEGAAIIVTAVIVAFMEGRVKRFIVQLTAAMVAAVAFIVMPHLGSHDWLIMIARMVIAGSTAAIQISCLSGLLQLWHASPGPIMMGLFFFTRVAAAYSSRPIVIGRRGYRLDTEENIAFTISGIAMLAAAAIPVLMFFDSRNKPAAAPSEENGDAAASSDGRAGRRCPFAPPYSRNLLFLMPIATGIVIINSIVVASISRLMLFFILESEPGIRSALITLFEVSAMLSLLLGVFLVTKVDEIYLLMGCSAMHLIGSLFLFMSKEGTAFFAMILIGLGVGPVIPAVFSMMEKHVILTPFTIGVLVFAMNWGRMAWAVGQNFFVQFNCIVSSITIVLLIGAWLVRRYN